MLSNLENNYKNEEVLKKYYQDGLVETPFGRKIKSDDFHALNYLLQSTSSDNCLSQAIKISKFLRGRHSFVHSVVHDSITIDFHKDDRDIIHQIKQIFIILRYILLSINENIISINKIKFNLLF